MSTEPFARFYLVWDISKTLKKGFYSFSVFFLILTPVKGPVKYVNADETFVV